MAMMGLLLMAGSTQSPEVIHRVIALDAVEMVYMKQSFVVAEINGTALTFEILARLIPG